MQAPYSLPTVKRGVSQIEERSRRLAAKSAQTGGVAARTKAHFLLANRGFDPDKIQRNLNAISLKSSFEPTEQLSETDMQGYLRHQRDMVLLTAFEEEKHATLEDFNKQYISSIESDWENQKSTLLEALGYYTGGSTLASMATEPVDRESNTSLYTSVARTHGMTTKKLAYAKGVHEVHEDMLRGQPQDVVSKFQKISSMVDDHNARKAEVVDCWELVKSMLFTDTKTTAGLPEGQYSRQYMQTSTELQNQFIFGSRRFLELQYRKVIQAAIRQAPRLGQLGGQPGLVNEVRAYVRIKFELGSGGWPSEFEDVVNGYPLWPCVYYCLRCGDTQAALELVGQDIDSSALVKCLAQWNGKSQTKQAWSSLSSEYSRSVKHRSGDAFKRAVYDVVGNCDPSQSNHRIFSTTQDFVWLKLTRIHLASLVPSDDDSSDYSIQSLQKHILQFGAAHFSPMNRNPLLYFQVLIATLQFERAIEYLFSVESYMVEAAHFALALKFYGALSLTDDDSAGMLVALPEITKARRRDRLNLSKLLQKYVKPLIRSDPATAAEYLCFIAPEKLQVSALASLITQSRAFDLLLGGHLHDGTYKEGVFTVLMGREKCHRIALIAADECEVTGAFADAVKLYDLAENYDRVVAVLNSQIAQSLCKQTDDRERNEVCNIADKVWTKYSADHLFDRVVDGSLLRTFSMLLQLLKFFDRRSSGQLESALEIIEGLGILPFTHESLGPSVELFKTLDVNIKRNFADILLAAMDTLLKLFERTKQELYRERSHGMVGGGSAREQFLERLHTKAKNLVAFSGLVDYRMPADTNSRLVKMEMAMMM